MSAVTAPVALCRLCRQPLPRGAVKCPSCRARVTWSRAERGRDSPRAGRGWRIAACVLMVALVAVVAVAYRAVSRDLRAPVSSADTAGHPSSTECAELIARLVKPSSGEPSVSPEVRERLRQCLERR